MSLWIRLCNHTYIHTYIHGTIEQTVRDDATLTTAAIPPRANESIAQHELVSRCLCEGDVRGYELCAASVLSVGVCENRDGWLVAWGFCG